jgi:hypothetical protein
MNLKLNLEIEKSNRFINHENQLLFLGSCFSDEINAKFNYNGFNTLSNPFGTIFHPLILSQFIDSCFNENTDRIFNRNDIYLSWDASSSIYGFEINKFEQKLIEIRTDFFNRLKSTHTLFITFGTAWGYHLIENSELVANCHKMPSSLFYKELSNLDLIVTKWTKTIERIKVINPSIQVVFTVSPVRHIKDGLIQNNQSKSILIESIRRINQISKTSYFPSYEIMIDELRDYRFYKSDLIHPSEEAINYIWSKIQDTFFEAETIKLVKEINNLKKQISHSYLHPESKETLENKLILEAKIIDFQKSNPSIILR